MHTGDPNGGRGAGSSRRGCSLWSCCRSSWCGRCFLLSICLWSFFRIFTDPFFYFSKHQKWNSSSSRVETAHRGHAVAAADVAGHFLLLCSGNPLFFFNAHAPTSQLPLLASPAPFQLHMYVHIHTYSPLYIHKHVYICINIHKYTCIHVYTYAHAPALQLPSPAFQNGYTYIHIYIYIYLYIYIYIYIYMFMFIYVYVYMCVCVYIIHTYVSMYI